MSDRVRLYAWAAPALDTNALPDHTWVTTYDNRKIPYPDIKAVTAAGEHYWYCWGKFRAKGGAPGNPTGILGNGVGRESVASCLALPDKDCRSTKAARGTVFCCMRRPLREVRTVAKARGYWWIVFRFGTYGRNESDWIAQRDSCSSGR